MDKILIHLRELGLTEKEARVYVALVELGRGTAYAISKISKIKRPTTYIVLEDLRRKGLVSKVPHIKNQIFIAKDPNELFTIQEEKIRNAKRALPGLLALSSAKDHSINTYFFEGMDGMKEALEYKRNTVADKELLCIYAKSDKGLQSIPKFYFRHNEILEKQNTFIRGFIPNHPSLKGFRKYDNTKEKEIITLPSKSFSPNVSLEISDSFVKILLHKQSQAMVIESKDYSQLMKQIFELIWQAQK